ncbi:MAG TPA: hypothetical protein VF681_05245 [Abditibacteriaceae bacterium]|jgi:hypothetical protein
MQLTLIINSIVCVLGVAGGALLAVASFISIANMTVPWQGVLLFAAGFVPVAFAISGIGAWVANARGSSSIIMGLIAFPWIYLVAFVLLMLVSFR